MVSTLTETYGSAICLLGAVFERPSENKAGIKSRPGDKVIE